MTAAFLFCADPLAPQPTRVDPHYADAARTARELDAPVAFIDHDALTAGDAARAVRRVPTGLGPAWYRGWMVTPGEYTDLAAALDARGCTLLTSPAAYATAHELPGWYDTFAAVTPASAYTPHPGDRPLDGWLDEAATLLGPGAAIVKDYTKSRKHEPDAFFIPDTGDRAALRRVVEAFIERQGDWLAGGIVLRAFEDFIPAGGGGGEARIWWLDGEPVATTAHPDTPDVRCEPDLTAVAPLVARLPVRFVTTDLALRTDGTWRLVEAGDGQVSDWPTGTDIAPLIAALADAGCA